MGKVRVQISMCSKFEECSFKRVKGVVKVERMSVFKGWRDLWKVLVKK